MPSAWTWMTRPNERSKAFVSEEAAHRGKRSMRVEASTGQDAAGNPQFTFVRTEWRNAAGT